MDTFKDLYEFLQLYEENNIITWLKEPWVGKDKQESLLRLFAGLGLMYKIKSYDICKGNYNKKTIRELDIIAVKLRKNIIEMLFFFERLAYFNCCN